MIRIAALGGFVYVKAGGQLSAVLKLSESGFPYFQHNKPGTEGTPFGAKVDLGIRLQDFCSC